MCIEHFARPDCETVFRKQSTGKQKTKAPQINDDLLLPIYTDQQQVTVTIICINIKCAVCAIMIKHYFCHRRPKRCGNMIILMSFKGHRFRILHLITDSIEVNACSINHHCVVMIRIIMPIYDVLPALLVLDAT